MRLFPRFLGIGVLAAAVVWSAEAQSVPEHMQVHVVMPGKGPVHGRLLLFLQKDEGKAEAVLSVNPFHPTETAVAAREISTTAAAGATVDLDGDDVAYPGPFSTLPAGKYVAQALLDVGDSYGYGGEEVADWVSAVVPVTLPLATAPTLVLDHHPASPKAGQAMAEPGRIEEFRIASPKLTAFSGRETAVTGWVVLPPGYNGRAKRTYPTVYWTHGFGGTHAYGLPEGAMLRKRMEAGTMPRLIWVMLDESLHTGTHEFADSVNNGPWGAALTTETIPALERRYRMDGRVTGRFLNGHSSGGWATLQLQVNYPRVFGGTWSTSPDPSDFHDFTGVDLYAPHANMFRTADGQARPLVRMDGKVVATVEQFSRLEEVLGTEGGQLRSFDWVFSPRGENGRPMPMFDRVTGEVDPAVVRFWHDHYDLSALVKERWEKDGPALRGKVHLYVGTADTFYLDGAAHLLDAALQGLGAGAEFHFLPGRTHFDLYAEGKDRMALFDAIAKEMYAVARPGRAEVGTTR